MNEALMFNETNSNKTTLIKIKKFEMREREKLLIILW